MQSTTPSLSAARKAATSAASRSGGFIFACVSYRSQARSVSVRWWGVTSAVTRMPSSLARRTSSTGPRVEMWHRWTCPPVRPASNASRATMISSAAAGMPFKPRRAETSPSCITPASASVGSSQWSATGIPNVRAYSRAVRIRWLDTTGLPSSETATAPAPTISPNSERRSPFCPTEIAPIGYTRVSPARTDWRTMKPTAAWLSVTGSVFGMAPPAGEQIQHRHSHRHTVRDLIENHAVWTIGDPRVDLDATVHRPRMHDRERARRLLEPLERHAEHAVILAHARNEPLLHALELEPQHIEDVGPFDRFLD